MLLLKMLRKYPSLPLPSFRWLPVILAIPWCVDASLQSLPQFSQGVLLVFSVSLNISFCIRIPATGLKVHLILYDFISFTINCSSIFPVSSTPLTHCHLVSGTISILVSFLLFDVISFLPLCSSN